ncbi:MAG: HAMP domain-containing sensor histidine kinase, partial [Bacillota bacterium]|nr:HAMP domain-containing sensor histidine kinase [Bacillota bacterium]
MNNSNKTIRKRIFFSHIFIIIISLILTSVVFNICLNLYIKAETRKQLVSAAELIQKSIKKDLFQENTLQNTKQDSNEIIKSFLKIDKVLKQTQTFLNINYAILGSNNNLIYPKKSSDSEYNLLQNDIIPTFKKEDAGFLKTKKNVVVSFEINGTKYSALKYATKLNTSQPARYLLLYSDLNNGRNMIFIVNAILLGILLITAVIAVIISNTVSKMISNPISQLSELAGKIGERDYIFEPIKHENDEIGQLADTMYSMAQKLNNYDNAMKTFMQNASHEMRTPLMSIQGYAEGIKFGVVENINSAVDIIISESKHLTTIVQDLLYLTKIDTMQEKLVLETLKAEDFLKGCIDRISGIALKNDKTIEFICDTNDLTFMADEEMLS